MGGVNGVGRLVRAETLPPDGDHKIDRVESLDRGGAANARNRFKTSGISLVNGKRSISTEGVLVLAMTLGDRELLLVGVCKPVWDGSSVVGWWPLNAAVEGSIGCVS